VLNHAVTSKGTAVMRTDALGKFIREVMPKLGADERIVALEIYKGLAASRTISLAELSDRTGLGAARVEAIILPWPGVYRDEAGDIVGFWGLTAQPVSKHVLRINGQSRYAWCDWDCLFIPALLGESVQVRSVCPQTGDPIDLFVARDSVEQVRPATTVLSMLLADVDDTRRDIVSSFCHFVHFFKDEEAARKWAATRPGTRIITLDQGLELGRIKNECQFGERL
jgi:alkylmercury lyase